MAKSNLSKFLTGVAVVSAGVALGLAVYNKFDKIKKELEDEEFEDDEFFEDDYEEDMENDYVVINADTASDAASDDCEEEEEEECADTTDAE